MATNTQFSIAVHVMAALAYGGDRETTSAQLAKCVNTSPSFVRRGLARLAKAGLVQTTTGKNGSCRLAREAKKITLRDVYQAVGAPKAFAIHEYREQKGCAVSCNIKAALMLALDKAQQGLEESLDDVTLADVLKAIPRG
jgi:Rrf2 family protein